MKPGGSPADVPHVLLYGMTDCMTLQKCLQCSEAGLVYLEGVVLTTEGHAAPDIVEHFLAKGCAAVGLDGRVVLGQLDI